MFWKAHWNPSKVYLTTFWTLEIERSCVIFALKNATDEVEHCPVHMVSLCFRCASTMTVERKGNVVTNCLVDNKISTWLCWKTLLTKSEVSRKLKKNYREVSIYKILLRNPTEHDGNSFNWWFQMNLYLFPKILSLLLILKVLCNLRSVTSLCFSAVEFLETVILKQMCIIFYYKKWTILNRMQMSSCWLVMVTKAPWQFNPIFLTIRWICFEQSLGLFFVLPVIFIINNPRHIVLSFFIIFMFSHSHSTFWKSRIVLFLYSALFIFGIFEMSSAQIGSCQPVVSNQSDSLCFRWAREINQLFYSGRMHLINNIFTLSFVYTNIHA